MGTTSYHWYITRSIERMLTVFHHFYQFYSGYVGTLVRFLPVDVEVAQTWCSKLTILTIKRLQFIMNLTDVLPQIDGSHEGFLTSVALVLFPGIRVQPVEILAHWVGLDLRLSVPAIRVEYSRSEIQSISLTPALLCHKDLRSPDDRFFLCKSLYN